MKLYAQQYTSPLPTEDKFENVFIEDTGFSVKRNDKYFSTTFEMYHLKNGNRITLDTFTLQFLGVDGDSATTNRTTVMSIPNPDYEAMVAAIPTEVTISNPDYESDVDGSQEFITITNPDYEQMLANVPVRINTPMINYLIEHQGVMPEDYTMVDYGYPNYTAVMPNFDGGTLTSPELFLNNDFAKAWFLENVFMKGEKVGLQFQFVTE